MTCLSVNINLRGKHKHVSSRRPCRRTHQQNAANRRYGGRSARKAGKAQVPPPGRRLCPTLASASASFARSSAFSFSFKMSATMAVCPPSPLAPAPGPPPTTPLARAASPISSSSLSWRYRWRDRLGVYRCMHCGGGGATISLLAVFWGFEVSPPWVAFDTSCALTACALSRHDRADFSAVTQSIAESDGGREQALGKVGMWHVACASCHVASGFHSSPSGQVFSEGCEFNPRQTRGT